MPDDSEWRELGTYETRKFIKDVTDSNFADLFNGPAYELWARNLRFFDGYEHYMLLNKSVFPGFVLQYISNGENHYFLDGSEYPLEFLIRKHDCLHLNEDNVLAYLEFHSDVTFYPYRKVKFVTNPEKAPYSGAGAMGHHFKTQRYFEHFELEDNAESGCFYVTLPVLYNGETVKGRVQILKTGEINVVEPVNIPLMDGKRRHNPLDYDHPHEKELLDQNLAILVQSTEGKRLWDTIKEYKGDIRVVSGVGSNAYAPLSTQGFIVAPEHLETPSPYQVIALAGLLREKELQLMGKKRPEPFGEQHEVLEQNLGLNLDILLEICIIVSELAEAGHEDVLRKFKESGFGAFYSGYKNGVGEDEMIRILARHFKVEVVEE
ncbi:MAG: hypothetical protein R3E13_01315 [Alphaproteobacteria bacterium]